MLWQTFTRQACWFAAVLLASTWAGVVDACAMEVGTDREALREGGRVEPDRAFDPCLGNALHVWMSGSAGADDRRSPLSRLSPGSIDEDDGSGARPDRLAARDQS